MEAGAKEMELDDQHTRQSTSEETSQKEGSTDREATLSVASAVMDPSQEAKKASSPSAMDVDEDEDVHNDIEKTYSDSSSSLSDLGTDEEQLATLTKIISDEQNKLSYTDRNILHEELHGVAFNEKHETPEMVQYALSRLSTELETLVASDWNNSGSVSSLSTGYILSSSRGLGANVYVNKPSFRLRFLRAEDFDPKKAAIRLMKYLNLVLKLFGAFALTRPIKLTDFKRNELKVLQAGWLQALPFRDRSGRRVFVWTGQMGMEYEAVLRAKISLYIMLAGLRDVESQQKGVVLIVYPTSAPSPPFLLKDGKNQLKYFRLSNEMEEALPFKTRALHHCIPLTPGGSLTIAEKILFKIASQASSAWLWRVKLHIGAEGELRKILSSYGIPASLIPTTNSGVIKTQEFRKWLKLQRRIDDLEAAEERFTHVDCPGSNDVVFRARSTMVENPGNVMFRSLVESKCLEAIVQSD